MLALTFLLKSNCVEKIDMGQMEIKTLDFLLLSLLEYMAYLADKMGLLIQYP